mgnify:CR=1 FL=1
MAKYILMFMGSDDTWEQAPAAERDAAYSKIGEWFATHGASGKIIGGEELQHRRTAKTVRFDGAKPTVHDGPYLEAKELIGGYAIVEVTDEREALELAKTWPGRSIVEVRPLVDHG